MKNALLASILFFSFANNLHAQIAIMKSVGKNSKDFGFGYGGSLKFGFPVSEAADLSLEAGANIFSEKDNSGNGYCVIPLKVGYRYTIDGTGTGLYVEPQLGYNAYGVRS